MTPRPIRHGFGLSALMLGVVAAACAQPVGPQPPPVQDPRPDRRSDLAGLRTLDRLGVGSGLTTSEHAEAQVQLTRLEGDESAQLDPRRRAKLATWLRNVGLAA